MRPLEIALVVTILALCLLTLLLRTRSLPRALYALPALIAAVHAIPLVEGLRWQMAAAYGAVLLLLILAGQPAAFFRRKLAVLTLAGALVSALLATLLPLRPYNPPTGPYAVGTTILHLTDRNREETYGDAPGAPREIAVQIWYPTGESGGISLAGPAPVIPQADRYADAFAREFGVPAFVMSHISLLKSHSLLRDSPGVRGSLFISEAERAYPVIVGSHGWRGFRALHTPQFEELASHGYIAVGIDHTYGALATMLRDGTVVTYDPAALPDGVPDGEYNANGARLQDVYEGDILFVLDELERLNRDSAFAGRMDLTRIGLFGHSTGGGAMIQACQSDSRCKAGFVMDGWVEPLPAEQLAQGVSQPFLFIRSEPWLTNDNAALLEELIAASPDAPYNFGITGTLHRDFTLQGILSPLLQVIGFTGKLDPVYTLDIVNAYMLAFFDQTLKGIPAPLLDGESHPYPEVTLES